MDDTYEKAYTEVIELLRFFPRESVEKIPKERLKLYIDKMDKSYHYKVDKSKTFEQQQMSEKTKAIFANIFRDYWATDYQRERILAKENYDNQKREEEINIIQMIYLKIEKSNCILIRVKWSDSMNYHSIYSYSNSSSYSICFSGSR